MNLYNGWIEEELKTYIGSMLFDVAAANNKTRITYRSRIEKIQNAVKYLSWKPSAKNRIASKLLKNLYEYLDDELENNYKDISFIRNYPLYLYCSEEGLTERVRYRLRIDSETLGVLLTIAENSF